MKNFHEPKSPALRYTHNKYFKGRPERLRALEEEELNAAIAQATYDLRTEARLSQPGLAKLVGTQHSAIPRLEDADYEGHSLNMLRRIAEALGQRLEFRFIPLSRKRQPAHAR